MQYDCTFQHHPLRSKGISRYVDLPEIIVCGDQSAVKSSVLEGISGMSFPTKDNLCTRFATELVLRRDPNPSVKLSVTPSQERPADEKDRLSGSHVEIDVTKPKLDIVVEKAKEAMGLSDVKVFSTHTLRVELCGPTQPHLTMVDLPGLFRAGSRDQSGCFGEEPFQPPGSDRTGPRARSERKTHFRPCHKARHSGFRIG